MGAVGYGRSPVDIALDAAAAREDLAAMYERFARQSNLPGHRRHWATLAAEARRKAGEKFAEAEREAAR